MIPLVSIIIPAYNAERSIETAIQSALVQTWENIEIVVVDDGSTDCTAQIVNNLVKKDSRVRFIQFDANMGTLVARLTGINAATGQFITFLDSDDYLDSEAIEICLDMKTENGSFFDIVQFGIEPHYAHKRLSCDINWTDEYCQPPAKVLFGSDIQHLIFREQGAPWCLYGKIFNANIAKKAAAQIPAQRLTMAEDACICFHICAFAQTYIGLPYLRAYHYNIDAGASGAVERKSSLSNFEKFCTAASAAAIMENFAHSVKNRQNIIEDFEATKNTLIDHCILKLSENVEKKDRADAFDLMLAHWRPSEIAARLASIYNNSTRACIKDLCLDSYFCEARHSATQDCTRQRFAKQDCTPQHSAELHYKTTHRATSYPVKTIAIYYVRIHTGGAEKTTVNLINLWLKMGYKVVLFTDEPPCNTDYKIEGEVPRVVLPCPNDTEQGAYEKRARALQDAIKRHNIDTLVYCDHKSKLLTWDMMLAKMLNTRVIIHTHSSFMCFFSNNAAHEVTLTTSYKLADAIITLNESDTDFWISVNSNTHQVQNPITLKARERTSCMRTSKRILWVGRLCIGEKRPEDAIKIMSYVHELEPEATLALVGADNDPHSAKTLREMVAREGLEACVEFVGEVENVAEQMQASSIFLMTSKYESYCLALAESKAVGLPCVMYELPYIVTTKGNRGIVSVAQKDAKAAAYAICDILNDEQKYNRLSNEALAHAKELCAYNYEAKWRDIFGSLESVPTNAAAMNASSAIAPITPAVAKGNTAVAFESTPPAKIARAANNDAWDKTDVLSYGLELAAKSHAEEVRYLHCEIDARDVRLSEAQRRITDAQARIAQLEGELESVRTSKSFKVGVAVTALPRRVKDKLKQ